jgi:5-formyltetrahydrofolate cyclo-ligase
MDTSRQAELTRRKAELRRLIRARVEAIDPRVIAAWSAKIADRLVKTDAWREAEAVFVFLSMPHEVATNEIIERAFEEGKQVCVPRVHGRDIRFHRIEHLSLPWERHPFGVLEPPPECPVVDQSAPTCPRSLVVAPGLAFDTSGHRLGYGGGFYDRFLTEFRRECLVAIIGITFSPQVVDLVPTGPNDVRLDAVLTEDGFVWTRGDA